jgi:hypothetical protein
MLSLLFFWVITPCVLVSRYSVSEEHTASMSMTEVSPEDEDNMFLRNVSIYPQGHMALKSRSPASTSSLPREHKISINAYGNEHNSS